MVKNSSKGFTLIETLVVLVITIVVLGVAVFNYNSGRKDYELDKAVNGFVTNLRQVEHWSVSGVNKTSGDFPQGGYGIYISNINNSSYIIFSNESTTTYQYNESDSNFKTIKKISLPPNIVIENTQDIAKIGCDSRSVGCIESFFPFPSISFQPPRPTVHMEDSTGLSPSNGIIRIVFKNTSTGKTKSVDINEQGEISINKE